MLSDQDISEVKFIVTTVQLASSHPSILVVERVGYPQPDLTNLRFSEYSGLNH